MADADTIPLSPLAGHQVPPLAFKARPPRQRTCLSGKLIYSDSDLLPRFSLTLDCAIRDISQGGAKIFLSEHQPLPPDVFLIAVKRCAAYRAKIVWMKFPARGLQFVHAYLLKAAVPEELKSLQHLWVVPTA
jgi:hypothetical protein